MGAIQVEHYLMLSAVLFTLGVLGVLLRRNAILVFMSGRADVERGQFGAVAFARHWGQSDGHVFVFFVVTVAAAEVAVGLALLVTIFPHPPEHQH